MLVLLLLLLGSLVVVREEEEIDEDEEEVDEDDVVVSIGVALATDTVDPCLIWKFFLAISALRVISLP